MELQGSRLARVEDSESAWDAFKESGCSQDREQFILEHVPLVKYVASRISAGLPTTVELEDLVSYGVFGLLDAVEKFDPDRGVKFETYAVSRIRGAIIDGLRSVDWVPRSVRQKAKELERTIAAIEARLGRPASDAEVCEAMNLTEDEYYTLISEVRGISLASLDEVWAGDPDDEGNLRFGEMIENPDSQDPTFQLERAEVKRQLADAIDALPERERLVIALYYHETLTLKEIGAVLGVSESRVSQIHTKAILRLRGKLARFRDSLVS